ncbi:MAG: BatA domain-containing protein [Gemmatimonadetes bacterium]|nr:BatA domain-containing protein [Gemmatimonadota bacterium]
MSFLYAWAIGLGAAALVPLILHLRRRQTDRRVSFPALRYLTRAEDERSKSLVASDLLLLAVRVGLLLALALAAAGPLLGRGGARDHEPTDVALVIDNSASAARLSGDRPLFETLIARARQALEASRPEDRIWVFPTVGAPIAAGVGAARAAAALQGVELTDGGADLGSVVARAAAALPADEGRRREVQLVSDLQRAGFAAPREPTTDEAALVAYAPDPPAEPNGGVAELSLTGGTTVPSGMGHGVIVRTGRFGGGESDSTGEASLRLELDGRIAGAARAPWGAAATLGLPELPIGSHRGRIEIDPAGARPDDLRHFAIQVVPPPDVRFYGEDDSFLRVGIATLGQAGRLGLGGGPSVAVLEGAAAAQAASIDASTYVFVPPADPIDLPAFNQGLAAAGVGWRARTDADRGDLGLVEPEAAFSFQGVRVRARYRLQPAGGGGTADTTLLVTDDGEPWLVRTGVGDGLALVLGSAMTPESTDLPAHPAMIPFLESLLVHWSHVATWPPSDFEAGASLALPSWASEVEAPAGDVRTVEGGGRYEPARAGVYTVRGTDSDGTAREVAFAANVPRRELDPSPVETAELEELFPGRPVFTAGPDAGAWESGVFRARRGRDAAPWLLLLALALVAAELMLATPGRSRRSTAGGETSQGKSEAVSGASS